MESFHYISSHCKGTAHAKSVFINPYFLFDDNFSFRQIKQHILDKGLHKAFRVNGRGEKKEEKKGEIVGRGRNS